MPVHIGKDKKGNFAQWGGQKKYHFTGSGKSRAIKKAEAQGRAAYSSGYKKKK